MSSPQNSEPPKKRTRLQRFKRLMASAAVGVLVGLACRLLPPQWQLPCQMLFKLVALLAGGAS